MTTLDISALSDDALLSLFHRLNEPESVAKGMACNNGYCCDWDPVVAKNGITGIWLAVKQELEDRGAHSLIA